MMYHLMKHGVTPQTKHFIESLHNLFSLSCLTTVGEGVRIFGVYYI
jgi:hypothetical protein